MEGTTDPRVQELKRQIARGRYHVDGSEIAEVILRKLALVERGRRATATSEPAFDPAEELPAV
jgi:Anti-sigma-28 factor, FlgM